jgi:glycosyltransferase involved in cell wall biosynthesis
VIISDKHRFVFVHVPKCAGTTIRWRLKHLDDRNGDFTNGVFMHPKLGLIDYVHLPMHILRDHFPAEFAAIRDYWSFAITRDPYARFASSLAQHLNMYGAVPLLQSSVPEIEREIEKVIAYLRSLRPGELPAAQYIHFHPQVGYLSVDGERIVKSVYTMDQVDQLLEDVAKLVGADFATPHDRSAYPMENRSIIFRNDYVRRVVEGIRPAFRAVSWVLPERIKERMRAYAYVPRDQRLGRLFQAAHVRAFIEEYYAEDIALWKSLQAQAQAEKRPGLKLSIAMATYNGARYLQEQLDSIAAQQRLPDELVVCDDASTDETVEILERFAERAPFPVHVHRNERNLGYVANFGKALSLASGDLVFLADQDDVWFPQKLAVFEARAQAEPSKQAIICDALLCDADLNPGVLKSSNLLRQGLRPEQNVGGACTAIRRDFLKLTLPMPADGFSHDDWIHSLARAIGSRTYIEAPMQYWRRHGGNASVTLNSVLHGVSSTFRARHIVESAFRDPLPFWLEHLRRLESFRVRLAERRADLAELVGEARAATAIATIDAEVDALRGRIAIVRLGRLGRAAKVLHHYRNGGYGGNRGLLSAIKDMIRPRSQPVAN